MTTTAPRDQADGLRTSTPPAPTARAPWLAVAGAKGGVGKTLLATNLALLLARAGHRTLLVDLDPGCGDVDVHLRLHSPLSLEDVVAGRCPPAAAIATGPAGLAVLAGRSGSTELAHADPDHLERVFAAVAAAARDYDVVVCDTGAGIGPAVLATLVRCDLVFGVTTPDPASLTDTYALCKLLHARGRPLPRLVVNRVRSRDEAMRTAGKLAGVARKFLGTECQLAGWLQHDGLLELSVAEQRPFALHGQGPALEDLRALCATALSSLPATPRRAARPVPTRLVPLRPGAR